MEDEEEPLKKRLKIAKNAFNSIELMSINKEDILIEWFSKVALQSNTQDVWNMLYDCLNTHHIRYLRHNEIKEKTLIKLIKVSVLHIFLLNPY